MFLNCVRTCRPGRTVSIRVTSSGRDMISANGTGHSLCVTIKQVLGDSISFGARPLDEPPILAKRYANGPKETVPLHTLRVIMAALKALDFGTASAVESGGWLPSGGASRMVAMALRESDLEFRGVRA